MTAKEINVQNDTNEALFVQNHVNEFYFLLDLHLGSEKVLKQATEAAEDAAQLAHSWLGAPLVRQQARDASSVRGYGERQEMGFSPAPRRLFALHSRTHQQNSTAFPN